MPPFRHALDKSEETRLGGAQQETPEFPLPFRRQHHTAEPAAAAIGLLPEVSGKGQVDYLALAKGGKRKAQEGLIRATLPPFINSLWPKRNGGIVPGLVRIGQ